MRYGFLPKFDLTQQLPHLGSLQTLSADPAERQNQQGQASGEGGPCQPQISVRIDRFCRWREPDEGGRGLWLAWGAWCSEKPFRRPREPCDRCPEAAQRGVSDESLPGKLSNKRFSGQKVAGHQQFLPRYHWPVSTHQVPLVFRSISKQEEEQ